MYLLPSVLHSRILLIYPSSQAAQLRIIGLVAQSVVSGIIASPFEVTFLFRLIVKADRMDEPNALYNPNN